MNGANAPAVLACTLCHEPIEVGQAVIDGGLPPDLDGGTFRLIAHQACALALPDPEKPPPVLEAPIPGYAVPLGTRGRPPSPEFLAARARALEEPAPAFPSASTGWTVGHTDRGSYARMVRPSLLERIISPGVAKAGWGVFALTVLGWTAYVVSRCR